MQAYITAALNAGRSVKRTASDALILRGPGPRGHRVLVDSGGDLTAFGRFYEEAGHGELPRGEFDRTQAAVREDNTEYITVKGSRRVARRFDPAANNGAGQWRYTVLGRKFFADRKISYIVRVPTKFRGTRANGNAYSRVGYFPLANPISLPMTLSQAQRDARIRASVNAMIGADNILAEYSQEEAKLRRNVHDWQIMEQITQAGPDGGDPVTEVQERAMAHGPGRFSSLPFVEALTPAAFEERPDKLCVARQLAETTGISFPEILDLMDSAAGGQAWRRKGATSKMVFAVANALGRGSVCIHGSRTVEVHPGRDPICWTVWEGHMYAYADASVRKKLARRIPHDPVQRIKQPPKRQRRATAPEPWDGQIIPGDFRVPEGEMDDIRGRFLAQGRHPRVTLRDAWRTRKLHYIFTADEEHAGETITIHGWPGDWAKIADWLAELRRTVPGFDVEYAGQGIAGATLESLLRLLKVLRQRVFLEPEQRHEVLERYDYTCALCNTRGVPLQMDHKVRLTQSFGPQGVDQLR